MKKSTVVLALSIIVGGVLASMILAKPWITLRQAKPIVVKGYAEQEVKSDSGSLSASVTVSAPSNSLAYIEAGKSLDKVKAIVEKMLGTSSEVIELRTKITEVLQLDENGRKTNKVDYYLATRRVRINSDDVKNLKKLGRALFDLNAQGLSVSVSGPNFFVSNLDKVKLELIEKATANGRRRAELLATSSGETLGRLVSARQGIIQITKKNSSETTDWGVYDTETIDKVVKLVVTLEYEIAR